MAYRLTFSPLLPESPLKPGSPGGPYKQLQINYLAKDIEILCWES